MAEDKETVRCPFCEGRGQLSPIEIAEKLTTPELRKRMDARLAEILGEVVPAGPKARDFQTEVHSWNPTLPIWKRSPKE
jgi:hypothetical protein